MGQDRVSYRRDITLIEASRILDAQFYAQGVWLTGAQVELLRNTMMVLNNPRTFVGEYHNGYYLTATDNDWDAIRAIVADLERKLMGNDNTMWGYNARYLERWSTSDHAAGTQLLETMPVPAGYVYVVQNISVLQTVTAGSFQHLRASDDTDLVYLKYWSSIAAGIPNSLSVCVPLEAEDYIRATFGNTAEDEYLELAAWGYKMKVPV